MKTSNRIITVLFCAFLAIMAAAYVFLPKERFSENEKRFLAAAPSVSWGDISRGKTSGDIESWLADHIPWRDFFVGLFARADRAANLQVTKEIYVGKSGRLYERPCRFSGDVIQRNMEALNTFASSLDADVDMMLVPSSGFLMAGDIAGLRDEYKDDEIIASAYGLAGENVRPMDVLGLFSDEADPERLYYRTDHHWTSLGAYKAYSEYAVIKGRAAADKGEYSVSTEEGFLGTTYSRACFWDVPSEPIELWRSGGEYSVAFSDREGEFDSLFFTSHLEEPDKYPVFLDGNHPVVKIENKSGNAEGKLLVIRDSFANCLGCFLADSWESVTLVDLRYYKQPVSQLCREERFDDVLFVYSVGNFMTDSNIVWLE